MANDLYAHTMDIRQWISPKEAQELCHQYKVPYQNEMLITGIKIPGINQIYLKHNKVFLDELMLAPSFHEQRKVAESVISFGLIDKKIMRNVAVDVTDGLMGGGEDADTKIEV